MYRGLGIERIFTAFLKIYCDPGGLVLVLNTSAAEEVNDQSLLVITVSVISITV